MSASIIMTGDKEVDRLLATLEPKLQKKAIRKGTREGAKVVLERARSLVPVDTGTLLDTMTVRSAVGTGRGRLRRGTIGHMVTHRETGAEDPFYAHFVEFGTRVWQGDRYIRPALYDSAKQVVGASRKAIREGVEEIARKAR